ncbi:PP2C family protein-serine/threonine phosphatase [Kineococcus sp. SYSU DK002]|uniref:PP2C family protein-serine/threonine phosphatase n=1 Tax=Kineococcus sp. SYSU DK002 TaxID=3383123 RepID=UPI003D7D4D56
MPPITPQDLTHPVPGLSRRAATNAVALGLGVVAVLCVVDVAGGLVLEQRSAANISGTFALAPALTALSRSWRRTALVGVVSVLVAAALVVLDGVPWGTGAVRALVVLAGAVLSSVVAHVQHRQWAQLQDRRQAARTLQAAMLTRLPRPDHLQLTSRYLPASSGDQVGGDWYDAVVDADGATVLIIGDVVGHDIHAAAAMGQLRGLLRAYAVEGGQSPAQLLTRTDDAIARLGLDVLATAVVARVEQDRDQAGSGRRRLRWSNAGHPPPMLLLPADRTSGGRVERLTGDGDTEVMLGVGLPGARHDHVLDLPVDSTLLLYTDGLVERRDEELDEGLTRLAHAMTRADTAPPPARTPLDGWLDRVLTTSMRGGNQDDVAVLAVRAHREDRPRPAEAGPPLPQPGAPLLQ